MYIVKFIGIIIITAIIGLFGFSKPQRDTTMHKVLFEPATISVLKNPCMGWTIYSEGWEFDETFRKGSPNVNPVNFWKQMDEIRAPDYANILYIRILWSALEPTEGKYAWKYNPEFIQFVENAKKRNLKLAFRVYYSTKDVNKQGTPQYVFDAGAKFRVDEKGIGDKKIRLKDACCDDEIWLGKFEKFVEAFAKEYDNPEITDYVDGYGAGWWGEGHHVNLTDNRNLAMVIDKLTGFYYKNFKHIITVYNLCHKHSDPTIISDFELAKDLVYTKRGFLPRRDGLGSHWFSEGDKYMVNNFFFPNSPLIGESCYWMTNPDKTDDASNFKDSLYKFSSWNDVLKIALDDALAYHCNTFDLRVPREARFWIEQMPDQVQRFVTHGGYRIYPSVISYSLSPDKNGEISINHTWKNFGIGLLPNDHPNWRKKYKVAFGLLDQNTNEISDITVLPNTDPGRWVKGEEYIFQTKIHIGNEVAGTKKLVVSIFDTELNKPGIMLGLKCQEENRWYLIGDINIF